jgi:hypothetical protein
MNSDHIIIEIEDYLVPRLKLDLGEARLYYHLFRHSRLVGKHDVLVSVAELSEAFNCSPNAVKPRLRSLQDKGVIAVTNTGWAGTRIKVLLPAEIPGALPEETAMDAIDIETIDFYKDTKYRPAILEREQGRCFYCRRTLTDEDSGIDHADPQKANGTNSYRNVVAACHSCNSSKGDDTAEDFLRKVCRRGFLSPPELEERLTEVTRLKQGLLRPII